MATTLDAISSTESASHMTIGDFSSKWSVLFRPEWMCYHSKRAVYNNFYTIVRRIMQCLMSFNP